MVTDGWAATYRRRLIVKSYDELNGRRRGPDMRLDEGYQWRRPAGHRDRRPGAARTRSPTKGLLVAGRRTENEIAERSTGLTNGERDRRTANEIVERRTRSPNERY
ncbi:hypothetical protein JG687_00012200 [Phytophthora cactorum]|uniref:Uncharacterized protein n=1 Tax=Phytophthora cactorum TaxID=29920 RepID=A0A8T1U3R5_9STRA|nr:hypothetical protein JG687_00012200 [Phytophthora cactorum]